MSRIERRKQERLDEVRRFAKESDIPVHNMELLNVALTHTSYANEHRNLKVHDNERLEFLGDAVLDLAVGDYLFRRFPEWPEGDLTRAKASVVCKPACAECAANFHVGDYMLLGRGEEMSGGRTRVSILGNAFESVIGAVYLDNGYEVAAKFILGHMQKFLDQIYRKLPKKMVMSIYGMRSSVMRDRIMIRQYGWNFSLMGKHLEPV